MQTSETVQIVAIVIMSISVIVALSLGILSLRQTKQLQERQFKEAEQARQRDRREKDLDEITAWALEAAVCPFPSLDLVTAATASGGPDPWTVWNATILNWASSLATSLAKSHYVVSLAPKSSTELQDAIRQLTDALQQFNTWLAELLQIASTPTPDRPLTFNAAFARLEEPVSRIRESVIKVLAEAANIKQVHP